MFRWYKQAQVCWVYLEDVVQTKDENGSSKSSYNEFRQSTWFTRGWTLQELLAPQSVFFYDKRWNFIQNKGPLSADIAAVTGIGEWYITFPDKPNYASIAEKMSWASKRVTSRAEDIEYCLLGIFDVNLPLLYGEGGNKAFMRLQLEIIKRSDDESMFAWASDQYFAGMLASSPSYFAAPVEIPERRRTTTTLCNDQQRLGVPHLRSTIARR